MKKLLILSAIASVLLVSCGQKDTTNTTISTQTGAYPNAYASLPKFDEIIKKVPEKITSLPDFQACTGQAVLSCSATSARNQADETKDISWCDAIPDDNTKKSCRDSIAFAQVLMSGSVDDCTKLENLNLRSQCKTRLVSQNAAKASKIEQCDVLIVAKPEVNISSGALANLPIRPVETPEEDRYRDADDCRMQVIQRMEPTTLTNETCKVIQTPDMKAQCSNLVTMLRQTLPTSSGANR